MTKGEDIELGRALSMLELSLGGHVVVVAWIPCVRHGDLHFCIKELGYAEISNLGSSFRGHENILNGEISVNYLWRVIVQIEQAI